MTDEYPILFEITDRKGNNPVNDLWSLPTALTLH
jgi:hypothetical protein